MFKIRNTRWTYRIVGQIPEAQRYLLDAPRIRTSTQMIADDGALQPLGLGSGRLHAALA